MDTTIIRYKVKANRVAENKAFIRAVFDELKHNEPEDLRYVSFCLADGVSFVHISVVDPDDGEHPLQQSAAFSKFLGDIEDRCEEPPVASKVEIIGSYRLFWQKLSDAR